MARGKQTHLDGLVQIKCHGVGNGVPWRQTNYRTAYMLTGEAVIWVYPAGWADERPMVGVHVGGAERVFERRGQWRGWERFVVDIGPRGSWGGGGWAECVWVVIVPDKLAVRRRARRRRAATYMVPPERRGDTKNHTKRYVPCPLLSLCKFTHNPQIFSTSPCLTTQRPPATPISSSPSTWGPPCPPKLPGISLVRQNHGP